MPGAIVEHTELTEIYKFNYPTRAMGWIIIRLYTHENCKIDRHK